GADVEPPDVVSHDEEDVGLVRGVRWDGGHRCQDETRQPRRAFQWSLRSMFLSILDRAYSSAYCGAGEPRPAPASVLAILRQRMRRMARASSPGTKDRPRLG